MAVVETVRGPVDVESMGQVLMDEHLPLSVVWGAPLR